MFERPTHIYLNPVASDRVDEFERFLSEVVVPAIRAQRPDLQGRWHVLRPVAPEASDGSICTYAFVFDGGTVEEDWELDRLLPAHYGAEEAGRLLAAWSQTLVSRSRWLSALSGEDLSGEEAATPQLGWTFTPVRAG